MESRLRSTYKASAVAKKGRIRALECLAYYECEHAVCVCVRVHYSRAKKATAARGFEVILDTVGSAAIRALTRENCDTM